jgi:hypothetical protein
MVCSLLLILGITSYTLSKQRFAAEWEGISHTGFMLAERKARNALACKQYKALKVDSVSKTSAAPSNKQNLKRAYDNRRTRRPLPEVAKLNLAPLLSKNYTTSYELLYETTAQLLRLLYKDKLFPKDSVEYRLLDELIASARDQSKESALTAFSPKDPELQEIYYKMLKGTVSSYPPLADYFTLNRDGKTAAVHFKFASKPLLLALFGEKITETILQDEKKKWEKDPSYHRCAVTGTELQALVLEHTAARINLSAINEFMAYRGRLVLPPVVFGTDANTGITIRKKI